MQEKKQLISAWVDDECSPSEVQQCIQAIQESPELLRYWQCCHSMRDIAQHCYGQASCESLLEQINIDIEALPPLILVDQVSNVTLIKPHKRKSKHWVPMALAATIAFMAVLFITRQPASLSAASPQVAINQISTVVQVTKQSSNITNKKTEEPLATLDNRIAVDSAGNMYLADHLIDRKQPSIQRQGINPYIERVDY